MQYTIFLYKCNSNPIFLSKELYIQLKRTMSCSPVQLKNCVFCNIVVENDSSKISYQDDELIVFPDIRPAAKHHFLVCPKTHIADARSLTKSDQELLEKMVEIGKQVLNDQQGSLQDARFGFHWPPFRSIAHLHLHVISPVSEMGFLSRMVYKPNSMWFVSPEYVLENLK